MKSSAIRVLVSDPLEDQGVEILKKEKSIEVDVKTKLPPEELKKIIGEYDALIVRSATKVTKDVIEQGTRLKVIGRAGVGVDNVDLSAATKRGIIVMNTPEGNSISAAELTLSLMMSMSRNVVSANLSLRNGEWKRNLFVGTELYGKTLGVVGFGRIGREVAKRAISFGMKILAYDPFLSKDAVKQPEIEVESDLKKVIRQSDFITFHVPLNDETRNLINKDMFAIMKPGVRIINCARGGVVNEKDLCEAIQAGHVKGAALDVFEKEPTEPDNPLLKLPQVVATPHLGASTEEAQINVAIAVAEQVADALLNRGIRNAVNLPSLDAETYKKMQPWINLAEKVGLFHTQLFEGNIQEVEVSYSGEVAGYNLAPLTIAVLKGLLEPISGALVNFVNAPAFAKERGIAVKESKTTQVEDFANAISLTVKTAQATHAILGTLFGNKDPRIVRVNQYYMDAIPKGYMLVITNEDRPGTVGSIGTLLGKAKINIAEMTLGRDREGAQAMTVINIDQAISPEILKELKSLPHIIDVKLVKL